MATGGQRELVWTVVQRGRTPETSGTPIMATEGQRMSEQRSPKTTRPKGSPRGRIDLSRSRQEHQKLSHHRADSRWNNQKYQALASKNLKRILIDHPKRDEDKQHKRLKRIAQHAWSLVCHQITDRSEIHSNYSLKTNLKSAKENKQSKTKPPATQGTNHPSH
ncbi:hypothetical protein ACE6H2_006477 [Prunus campanulata]